VKQIPLTRGFTAFVDDADYELLSKFKWFALVCSNTVYAARHVHVRYDGGKKNGKHIYKTVMMHRFILGLGNQKSIQVDHRNGSGIDNRRENLRPCTCSQNLANKKMQSNNTSGSTGVYWSKRRNRWIAEIKFRGKKTHIGQFSNMADATMAYREKSKEVFGEFARTNFQGVN